MNTRFQNVAIFLLNIAGKYVFRIHFPAILPRRETIFLLYLAGKSILQDTAGKSALRADFPSNFPAIFLLFIRKKSVLRADFLLPDFPAIFSRKIGPSDRCLPRSPKKILLYLAGKRRKIAIKKTLVRGFTRSPRRAHQWYFGY